MNEIKLILTNEEVLTIQEGLLELQAKRSLPVINKITSQVKAQLNKKQIESTKDALTKKE